MTEMPAVLYSQAALLASDVKIAATLTSMAQLADGWIESISPTPVHLLLSNKLPIPAGKAHHQAIYLQLAKANSNMETLTVNHARLWQYMSLRFLPTNPQGMMQFQYELSIILEELAHEQPQKPLLQLVK